jgi:hypothetical protein
MLAPWALVDAPGRARLAPALAVLVGGAFLAERLAAWHAAGDSGTRLLAAAGAALRLYGDDRLWHPWQPWSAALLADGWWGLVAALWTLLVPAAALERSHGPAVLAALAAVLAALGSAAYLASGAGPLDGPGCDPLALGLAAAAAAALPGERLRWGVAWYAVVAVGWRELARTPLALGAALLLGQAAAHAVAAGRPLFPVLLALALCGAAGSLAGRLLAARR